MMWQGGVRWLGRVGCGGRGGNSSLLLSEGMTGRYTIPSASWYHIARSMHAASGIAVLIGLVAGRR